MKTVNHYVPRPDGQLITWAANYKEKIAVIGPSLGLSPEAITQQQALSQGIIDKLNRAAQKKVESAEAQSAKRLLRTSEVKGICDIGVGFKRHPAFTENIGIELGVIAPSTSVDKRIVKPRVWVKLYRGNVGVFFNKQKMQGVTIFSRVKGSTGWDEIATVKSSPFLDKRPLVNGGIAEVREYMAMCYDGFEDVGLESDIVSMLFGG